MTQPVQRIVTRGAPAPVRRPGPAPAAEASALAEVGVISRETLGERVTGELSALLVAGRLAPGDKLAWTKRADLFLGEGRAPEAVAELLSGPAEMKRLRIRGGDRVVLHQLKLPAGAGSVQAKGGTGWRLIIPTDPFPTRRTNWLFEKTIPGSEAIVVRTDPRDMDAERWWTNEVGLISFQNEVIKYLLYRVKY